MNSIFRPSIAALSALCLFALPQPGYAQANASVPIVVVDLSKVFDSHPQFQKRMESIKAAVKAADAEFQNKGKDIQGRVKQLQEFKPSSPEFTQLETETARLQAQIQADMQLKRKDFLEQEAKAYFETYQQVRQEIKAFAEANRIGLVLRFSSEKIDPTNRQSVLQGVNQPILYNQNGLDITHYIVDRLHRAGGGTAQVRQAAPATSGQQRR